MILLLPGCDEDDQTKQENEKKPSSAMKEEFGPFEGDLSADAAFDELAVVLENLAKRNDELTALSGFSSVDVPSVRANIVMLTTLITTYGGASEVTKARFNNWNIAIRQTFEDENKWGFQPWPAEEKQAWLDACIQDIELLKSAVIDDWD
jgi:hypothetical protein